MRQVIRQYLRQFVAWGIASRERYKSDLFFRTTIQIVVLQAALVLVCIITFAFSLYDPSQAGWALGAVALFAVTFGVVIARFTLLPTRDALRYQKIFMSNVAHELRTPISIIKTSTEVALIDDTLSGDVRKTFTDIASELDRVSEIINNLLSLSSLTRPERMQFQNVDLAQVVSAVLKRHILLARERDIKIIFKKDNYHLAWGNPMGLEQIITNLVKNAISFTPKDTAGTVTVIVGPYEDMVLLSVRDTGIGISQEDLFHVFEPFYRADTSRARKVNKGGSGLGLTIVNELVRAHQGKIQIKSAKRKGTMVSVYLPQGTPHHQPTEGSEVSVDFSIRAQNPLKV